MNSFNVNLSIRDCYLCKCCQNTYEKDVTVRNSSQAINLQNGYILNVLNASNNNITVLIQNGFQVIIRNIRNYPMQICIPDKCCKHIVTISGTIISST